MTTPDFLKPPENVSGKRYGELHHVKDQQRDYWVVSGHPHMIGVLKRVFPVCKTLHASSQGMEYYEEHAAGARSDAPMRGHSIEFPLTKRNVGDLNWFMMRYPLDVKDPLDWEHLLKGAQQHYEKLESMLEKPTKITPPPTFKGKLYEFQKEGVAFLCHNERALLADEMGLGKASPLDAKILTPIGWKLMGDIHVGDRVINPSGGSAYVMRIFPQGKQPVYRVTFSDGSKAECTMDHVWNVTTALRRFRNERPRLLTLRQIMDEGVARRYVGRKIRRHFIPMTAPVQYDASLPPPIKPYTLGALLGDGSLSLRNELRFTNSDPDIVSEVANGLPSGCMLVRKSGNAHNEYRISTPARLLATLRDLGLNQVKSAAKFVPEIYLRASSSDRLALLQGLFDTDGAASGVNRERTKWNAVEYCTVSKRMAHDVVDLVCSLGGTARLFTKLPHYPYKGVDHVGQLAYRLYIRLPKGFMPFRAPRKAARYFPGEKYNPHRAIESVDYMGIKECQCILLDSENGLYITDDYIVTHNTPESLAWLTTLERGPPWIIVVPPHLLPQWRREIKIFLGLTDESIHTIKGQTVYPLPKADIYLIHYLLLMHWKTVLPEYGFHAAIFDEIHEMRHSGTEKYSAASLLASSVDYIAGLSGTPFFNYGGEIWNVLNILEDKILGDYGSFSREWCWGYFGKQIARPAEFGAFLKEQGLLLRRLKEDVLDELPPKRRVIQSVDVDEGQYAELIAPVVDQALAIPQIQKAWDRGRAEMLAIDQTRRITGISKAHYVAAFVETLLEAGEPCILYGHHHDVIDIWLEDLRAGHHHPVFLTGRQDAKAKDEAQQMFMDGHTDVICVSLRSATGLNLQRARCVVFGELDWSPAVHTQAEDRAHRIGQKDSVLCYYLVCDAGTDQAMLETLGLKTSQFVEIMGDRPETEADRLNAQKDVKLHMQEVIKTLQKGGKKKVAPTPEIAQKIELLERMPRKDVEPIEPTIDDVDGVDGVEGE